MRKKTKKFFDNIEKSTITDKQLAKIEKELAKTWDDRPEIDFDEI